ncbi:MAG: Omp28-related outer membrane protein, partial [Alistipes sp.]
MGTAKEVSPRVDISAKEKSKEVFYRRMFTQQFTSTGCVACPNMNKTLNKIQQQQEWSDRMTRATFHMNFGNVMDPMHLSITQQYMIDLGMSGLPYVMFDLVKSSKINNGEAQVIEQMQRVMESYPAICGVAIESTFDTATKTVNFTAKVKASSPGEFRILAFLIEDKIVGAQSGE